MFYNPLPQFQMVKALQYSNGEVVYFILCILEIKNLNPSI